MKRHISMRLRRFGFLRSFYPQVHPWLCSLYRWRRQPKNDV